MTTTLQLGTSKLLRLDDGHENVGHESGELVSCRIEVAEQTAAALREPLGLPPLATCVLPEDRFAVAVAAGTPHAAEIVAGILTALAGIGVEREQVAIVSADAADTKHLLTTLPEEAAGGVCFETHDPSDDGNLCFAGATHAERPLMFNRRLVEAEVVLPVSCAEIAADASVFSGLFPAFSDKLSQQRLLAAAGSKSRDQTLRTEADEAGWMLGVMIVVQIVPGCAGETDRVLAGTVGEVAAEAASVVERHEQEPVTTPVDLVIATLTGDERQQNWLNVGKALASAARVAAPAAAVALCTELTEELPEPIAELLSRGEYDLLLREMAGDEIPEAAAVGRLIEALERGPVYLLSELDPEWVEDIGLAPIAGEAELQRLIKSRPNFAVLEGAQHLAARLPSARSLEP